MLILGTGETLLDKKIDIKWCPLNRILSYWMLTFAEGEEWTLKPDCCVLYSSNLLISSITLGNSYNIYVMKKWYLFHVLILRVVNGWVQIYNHLPKTLTHRSVLEFTIFPILAEWNSIHTEIFSMSYKTTWHFCSESFPYSHQMGLIKTIKCPFMSQIRFCAKKFVPHMKELSCFRGLWVAEL